MRALARRRSVGCMKGEEAKRKAFVLGIALLIVVALVAGRRLVGAEEKATGTPITLKGTVVDTHCYVTHGLNDAKHTGCSNACIARGVPAGFLAEDGKLWMLFGEKPFSVKDTVAGMADVPAVLTGIPVERGGVRGIQIKSIERAKPTS
jgi:hypothetical protein